MTAKEKVKAKWPDAYLVVASRMEDGPEWYQVQKKPDQNVLSEIAHFLDRWKNRLTVENPNFIEHYVVGELDILLNFTARGVIEERSANFDRENGTNQREDQTYILLLKFSDHTVRQEVPKAESAVCACGNNQEPMFFGVSQIVQTPKNIALPSFIWLDVSDRVFRILPRSLYFGHRFGFKFLGTLPNREVNVRDFGRRGLGHDEKICHVVKCGLDVLDGISSDEGDRRANLIRLRDVIDRSALRVTLDAESIGLGFSGEEFVNSGIEIRDVIVGPFDFKADTVG